MKQIFAVTLITIALTACGGGSGGGDNSGSPGVVQQDAVQSLDSDADGVIEGDNCPTVANSTQVDRDGDGAGDACDAVDDRDPDGDGVFASDNCPLSPNPDQADANLDGIGNDCDPTYGLDLDNDGVLLPDDNCPAVVNPDQADADGDGIGDSCDILDNRDEDMDGVAVFDNCPNIANPDQQDSDNDGVGDVCDDIYNSSNQTEVGRVDIPLSNSTPPTLDGRTYYRENNVHEWAYSAFTDSRNQPMLIDNLIVRERDGYDDHGPSTRWYAQHDGTYLYLLIWNTEENGLYQDVNDSDRAYLDDSVEIMIDGDNSKNSTYDGVNDFMVALRYNDSVDDRYEWGDRGSRTDMVIDYRTNHLSRTTGVAIYEIVIDIASAGITIGEEFGLEIQVNEDDDGGERDAKWSWAESTQEHRAYFDPSAFGVAILRP